MNFEERVDPEIAAVLESVPLRELTDIPAARAAREKLAEAMRAAQPRDPNIIQTDHLIPVDGRELKVRHYRAAAQLGSAPCLFWMHGGGHVLGSVDQDDWLMEHLVRTVGCVAVSVDWRRSPEHPFPAAIDDSHAGLAWTFANADELRVDRGRIAIGGSSSGAGLAAGLALLVRDRAEHSLVFQLLIYPMLDDRNITPSSHMVHHPKLWNRKSNLIGWTAYLGDQAPGSDGVSPYAAPTRATDLTGLPPAFIATGDLDLFVDEDIEYAQRLGQSGVPVELHVYPGAVHGFDLFAPHSDVSRRLVRDRDAALRRALFSGFYSGEGPGSSPP